VRLTEKVTVNALKDFSYFKTGSLPREKLDDDRAIGINYAFQPSLVLKLEHHWNQGLVYLEDVPLIPGGELLDTKYWIASLSTSF
jgi:hypothetical protein